MVFVEKKLDDSPEIEQTNRSVFSDVSVCVRARIHFNT